MDNAISKSDMLRGMAQGWRSSRTYDYTGRVREINKKLANLTLEELEAIEEQIDFLLRRHRIFSDCPQIDEQPALVAEGHARRTAPHGATGGLE